MRARNTTAPRPSTIPTSSDSAHHSAGPTVLAGVVRSLVARISHEPTCLARVAAGPARKLLACSECQYATTSEEPSAERLRRRPVSPLIRDPRPGIRTEDCKERTSDSVPGLTFCDNALDRRSNCVICCLGIATGAPMRFDLLQRLAFGLRHLEICEQPRRNTDPAVEPECG